MQVCVLVQGLYQLEVTVFGYDNPTGRCQECLNKGFNHSGCCDEFFRLNNCSGSTLCDTFFVYCLRQPIGRTGRGCSYFGNKTSDFNPDDSLFDSFQSPVLGLENPIILQGLTNAYMVYIIMLL